MFNKILLAYNGSREGKSALLACAEIASFAKSETHLLAVAEEITKCLAVCARCGEPANRSQRLAAGSTERIEVGAAELYEARCRACFEPVRT